MMKVMGQQKIELEIQMNGWIKDTMLMNKINITLLTIGQQKPDRADYKKRLTQQLKNVRGPRTLAKNNGRNVTGKGTQFVNEGWWKERVIKGGGVWRGGIIDHIMPDDNFSARMFSACSRSKMLEQAELVLQGFLTKLGGGLDKM